MTITIIGLGLIGGSISLNLRTKWEDLHLIGYDSNEAHAQTAIQLGLVDEICPFADSLSSTDLVILAIPVDECVCLLPQILDGIPRSTTVMDTGSTKAPLCAAVADHPRRAQFVASHPMWGTEFSGPASARSDSFNGKAAVICEREKSSPDALKLVETLYLSLGMHLVYMTAKDHDLHTAYISHISHITSFSLANTVLEKEKGEKNIFELASGGFESTVRLAKSHADMWVPILVQNRKNILDVLEEHIAQLNLFRACLQQNNISGLSELIARANTIQRVLK